MTVADYEIALGRPFLQRTDRNQGQIDIICLAVNHSPGLRASQGLRDETVNENSTPFENDPAEELPRKTSSSFMAACSVYVSLCLPGSHLIQRDPPQIDKVKHEGQILPNIDLHKQSPVLL